MKTQPVNAGGTESAKSKCWKVLTTHLGLSVPAETSGEQLVLLAEEMWLGLPIYTVSWLLEKSSV